MDPATRSRRRAKLAAFTPKIGFPAQWRDYGALEVVRGDALGNAQRAARSTINETSTSWASRRPERVVDDADDGQRLRQPAWNEIVFPAAILQAPFLRPRRRSGGQYGGIGAVSATRSAITSTTRDANTTSAGR